MMNSIRRNIRIIISKNFKAYTVKNYCNVETLKQQDVKSEDVIKKIISEKVKEFQKLLLVKSPESEKICIEVKGLESNLRKKYGFNDRENLTNFPKFKFVDPEVDNQL